MTHTYQVTGMTCSGCEAKVKRNLLTFENVTAVDTSKETNSATISMDKHISLSDLQMAIGGSESKYQISAIQHNELAEQAKSWVETYKPLLLIFAFITGVSFLTSFYDNNFQPEYFLGMRFMSSFMAGFFLVFSFFKLLNLKGFAESYAMYDLLAMKIPSYGLIYPFIELALGISYLVHYQPVMTNYLTIIVMGFSALGVIRSVMNKQKIRCACLGAVFNLPMSTVTIIEDLLMVAMAIFMLIFKF